MTIGAHQSPVNGTDVWLTPPDVLNALGPFDLDPCACSAPRPWPTAKAHFTLEDDGLSRPWSGRVWMNPPYGGPTIIGPWMRKLAAHGRGTALIFARTETAIFFETVWGAAGGVLFVEGRLHFHYPDGKRAKGNSGGPSVLVAYGPEDEARLRNSGIAGRYVPLAQGMF